MLMFFSLGGPLELYPVGTPINSFVVKQRDLLELYLIKRSVRNPLTFCVL